MHSSLRCLVTCVSRVACDFVSRLGGWDTYFFKERLVETFLGSPRFRGCGAIKPRHGYFSLCLGACWQARRHMSSGSGPHPLRVQFLLLLVVPTPLHLGICAWLRKFASHSSTLAQQTFAGPDREATGPATRLETQQRGNYTLPPTVYAKNKTIAQRCVRPKQQRSNNRRLLPNARRARHVGGGAVGCRVAGNEEAGAVADGWSTIGPS